jgi:excisionase family DNA binding protein
MPQARKKSIGKAASAANKAATTQRRKLSPSARKKIASAARRAFIREPIAERIKNKVIRDRDRLLPLTDEPWYSLREIADRLGFAYMTVQRWTHKEDGLRYRRFGRTIKVPLSELERFSGGESTAA